MGSRTTSRTVTFRQPFFLRGMDAMQPPGDYVVEDEEVALDACLSIGFRRVGTWIWLSSDLKHRGVERMASIDADELAAALVLDAQSLPARA